MTPIWIPPAILLLWEKFTYLFCVPAAGNRRRDAHDFCGNLTTDYTQSLGPGARPFIYIGLSNHPIVRLPVLPFRAFPHRPSRLGHMFDRGSLVYQRLVSHPLPILSKQYTRIHRELCVFRYSVEILRGSFEISNIITLYM